MNRLLLAMLVAVGLAFGSVAVFGEAMASVYWVGELFLRALQMFVVPVVALSMIVGITSLGQVGNLGRLGGRTVLYYVLTNLAAALVGAMAAVVVQPGGGLVVAGLPEPDPSLAGARTGLPELLLGLVSEDLLGSLTRLELLPLLTITVLIGGALLALGERSRPVVAFCDAAHHAMLRVVRVLLWLAPLGVFGLLAGRMGATLADGGVGPLTDHLSAVGVFVGTVLGALALHALVVLPLVLWVTTRRNPLSYLRALGTALLTGFATASSAVTLPVTLQAVEEHTDVDARSARFVLPVGASINMDGTALYEAVAAVFIAQALGIDLSAGQLALVVLAATVASIGAAGIPGAGLVTLVLVLRAVDLPLAGVELVLAVDWLLDRFRTTVNVWGDAVGAAVVECKALQRGFVRGS